MAKGVVAGADGLAATAAAAADVGATSGGALSNCSAQSCVHDTRRVGRGAAANEECLRVGKLCVKLITMLTQSHWGMQFKKPQTQWTPAPAGAGGQMPPNINADKKQAPRPRAISYTTGIQSLLLLPSVAPSLRAASTAPPPPESNK